MSNLMILISIKTTGYRGAAHRARLLESILLIHRVRSYSEGFIVRNSMVQSEFNLDIWLRSYDFLVGWKSLRTYAS